MEHTVNLFRLNRQGDGAIPLQRLEVRRVDVLDGQFHLEDLIGALRAELKTPLVIHEGRVTAYAGGGSLTPVLLDCEQRIYQVTPLEQFMADPRSPRHQDLVRRLVSMAIKDHLVYGKRSRWSNGRAFYSHGLVEVEGGHICRGLEVEVVVRGGEISLAIDTKLGTLGTALGKMPPDLRQSFLFDNPYEVGARSAQGEVDPSTGHRHFTTRRQRNFVLREQNKLRRVYVAMEETRADETGWIWVRSFKSAKVPTACNANDLYPVLAPGEADIWLREDWRDRATQNPRDRQQDTLQFIADELTNFSCLGVPTSVEANPTPTARAVEVLPWPVLSLGVVPGEGYPFSSTPSPETRLEALRQWGPRELPDHIKVLEVVAVRGAEKLAEEYAEEVRNWLRTWKIHDESSPTSTTYPSSKRLAVRVASEVLPNDGSPNNLGPLLSRYTRAEQRPSMVIIFHNDRRDEGDTADAFHVAVHRRLGDELGIVPKLQTHWGRRKTRDVVLNALASLLSRAGVVLWGLHRQGDQPGLTHDVCVGIDVGGRDRASNAGGNDHLLCAALIGDDHPSIWWQQDVDKLLGVTGETLEHRHIQQVLGGALEKASLAERKHILWMHDGNVPPGEWGILRDEVKVAVEQGRLPADVTVTAVEVIKSGAWRILGLRPPARNDPVERVATWQVPHSGALWWIECVDGKDARNGRCSEALLITTGQPWNGVFTPDPLRLRIHTIIGEVLHREAAVDIWKMTHLNWRAPRTHTRVPLPLHMAQEMAAVLRQGRSLKWAPL